MTYEKTELIGPVVNEQGNSSKEEAGGENVGIKESQEDDLRHVLPTMSATRNACFLEQRYEGLTV